MTILIFSSLFLSACRRKGIFKSELLDDAKEIVVNPSASVIDPNVDTDENLLRELETDTNPSLDSEFSALENELKQP